MILTCCHCGSHSEAMMHLRAVATGMEFYVCRDATACRQRAVERERWTLTQKGDEKASELLYGDN